MYILLVYIKVKVAPYTFVRRGVPVREDTYPEPSECAVVWTVPLLTAFVSHCCHRVPIRCWVNSERAFSQDLESGSNRRPSAWESCAQIAMPPRPLVYVAVTKFYESISYLFRIHSCLLRQ